MKNAILTWYHYQNYGTALQAYALQKFLNSSMYETELIKYIPEYKSQNEKKNIKKINIYINNRKKKYLNKIIKKKYYKNLENKSENFKEFLSKINLTEEEYNKKNLKELNQVYDNFIVGSDQIWNPNNIDYTYFLDFVDENKNKIAYAPSFGVKQNEYPYQNNKLKNLLNRFDYISVREEDGKYIIKKLINKSVKIVLDPTLLLEKKQWNEFVKVDMNKTKYILCYFLGEQKYYWKYVKKLQKETGLEIRIIPIQPEAYFKKGTIESEVGPMEFLDLMANAEIICTDSFHGMVFSIIFEKKFSVLKRFKDNDRKSQNSRICNLLKLIDLEEFFIDENFEETKFIVNNYEDINNILAEKRNESKTYILDAINGRKMYE